MSKVSNCIRIAALSSLVLLSSVGWCNIHSYAADIGESITAEKQVLADGVKYPALGSTIVDKYEDSYKEMLYYSDDTLVFNAKKAMYGSSQKKGESFYDWMERLSADIPNKNNVKHLVINGNGFRLGEGGFTNMANLEVVIFNGESLLLNAVSNSNAESAVAPLFSNDAKLEKIVVLDSISVPIPSTRSTLESNAATYLCNNLKEIVFDGDIEYKDASYCVGNLVGFYTKAFLGSNVEKLGPKKEVVEALKVRTTGRGKVDLSCMFGTALADRVESLELDNVCGSLPICKKLQYLKLTNAKTLEQINCPALTELYLPDTEEITQYLYIPTAASGGNLDIHSLRKVPKLSADLASVDITGLTDIDTIESRGSVDVIKFGDITAIPKISGNDAVERIEYRSVKDFNLVDEHFKGMVNLNLDLSDVLIKSIGSNALYNASGVIIDESKVETLSNNALCGYNVDTLTFNNLTKAGISILQGATVDTVTFANPNLQLNTNFFKGNTSLTRINWLCKFDTNSVKEDIPPTARIYCIKDSAVETWCINKGVAYTVLTDDEVDDIVKGKSPTLSNDDRLYDYSGKSDLLFKVDLGKAPSGATGIRRVLIDNKTIPKEYYTFNGIDTIVVKKEYLDKLSNGSHALSVEFDNGIFKSGASITVINSTNPGNQDKPPEALVTINYEFYKDYPDHVIIPVQLNGASKIAQLKIGDQLVDESDYELSDSAIIIDSDYVAMLPTGKYRVLPTFDDINNTTISNIQLLIYEKAADRAAPYLLQSRILFKGKSFKLSFDPGIGELYTTKVLALVLDNKMILENGDTKPFSTSSMNDLQDKTIQPKVLQEFWYDLPVASSSDLTRVKLVKRDKPLESSSTIEEQEEESEQVEIPIIESKPEKNTIFDLLKPEEEESVNTEEESIDEEESVTSFAAPNSLVRAFSKTDNVFEVDGFDITVDGDYINSLHLKPGNYLMGAVFDNTEKTTDVRKVILTIPEEDKPEPDKPDQKDPEPEVKPSKPEPEVKPSKPDSGGSSGGGSSKPSGGGSSKPSGGANPSGPAVDKPKVPNTGGAFKPNPSNPNDYEYVKPDGSLAKNEWIGDGKDWYNFDEAGKLRYDWYLDVDSNWYLLNREHDGRFGAAMYGWVWEKQDNKWYYLDTVTTAMRTGWNQIKGNWYYLTPANNGPTYTGDNINGWFYTNPGRPYGSLYTNETTPDGYQVDSTGKWIK